MNFITAYGNDDDNDDDLGGDIADTENGEVLLCEMCKRVPRRYKCPRCSVVTCSLECCKLHKSTLSCNGKRDRAKHVNLSEYNENHLVSDYHFLEDILQCRDKSKRALAFTGQKGQEIVVAKGRSSGVADWPAMPVSTSSVKGTPVPIHNKSLKKLIETVLSRGTRMITMPPMMSKRESNTTRFVRQHGECVILWKIGLVFILDENYTPSQLANVDLTHAYTLKKGEDNADSISSLSGSIDAARCLVTLCMPTVNENRTLRSLLDEVFDNSPENAVLRHALRSIRPLVQSNQVRMLLQALPSPANNPQFHEASLDFTVKHSLEGKTVIEHPTFFVGSLSNTRRLAMLISTQESDGEIATSSTAITPLVSAVSLSSPLKRKADISLTDSSTMNPCDDISPIRTTKRAAHSLQEDDVPGGDEGEAELPASNEEHAAAAAAAAADGGEGDEQPPMDQEEVDDQAEEQEEQEFWKTLKELENAPVEQLLHIIDTGDE